MDATEELRRLCRSGACNSRVAALVEQRADVNGYTHSGDFHDYTAPLHIAVIYGHDHLIQALVNASADVNGWTRDVHSRFPTPLHLCIHGQRPRAVAAALVRAGAHLDAQIPYSGATPLQLAREKVDESAGEGQALVNYLLKAEAERRQGVSQAVERWLPVAYLPEVVAHFELPDK